MSDFVGEQSRVHIMPISAKWKHKSSIHIGFIVFNGGNNLFCQEFITRDEYITINVLGAYVLGGKLHLNVCMLPVKNS